MTLIGLVAIAFCWALWLTTDRPALALALGLFSVVALLIALRRSAAAPVGELRIDDHGHVFWRRQIGNAFTRETSPDEWSPQWWLMVPVRWQRAEGSVWIQLQTDARADAPSGTPLALDLRLAASGASPDDWAALQRWMIWMERGRLN